MCENSKYKTLKWKSPSGIERVDGHLPCDATQPHVFACLRFRFRIFVYISRRHFVLIFDNKFLNKFFTSNGSWLAMNINHEKHSAGAIFPARPKIIIVMSMKSVERAIQKFNGEV